MAARNRDRGRGPVERRRRQQIVFVPNVSDPVNDPRRSESRKLVARHAMLGRRKNILTRTRMPGSPAPSTRYGARTPSTSTSSGSPEQSPVNPKSPPMPLMPLVRLTSRRPSKVVPSAPTHRSSTKNACLLPTSNNDRRFDSDERIEEVGAREHGKQSMIPWRRPASVSIAGLSAMMDPFDCLPIEHSPHTQELLYCYLNGQFLSPAITEGSGGRLQRVQFYRRSTWFPLMRESKATMNALVAYMETTPDLPIKARKRDFLFSHVHVAYESLRLALDNPQIEADDSVCVAVILLMLTAQRLGEIETFRTHAKGLVQLLNARSKVLRRDKVLRSRERDKWDGLNLIINGPPSADLCKFCQNANLRDHSSSSSPDSMESTHHTPAPSVRSSLSTPSIADAEFWARPSRGAGFYQMISGGQLSPSIRGFVDQILIWSTISELVRHDGLSASVACTHAWADERLGKQPPLDSAFFFSVRLCLYLCTWLEDGHSCWIVKRIAMAASMSIQNSELNMSKLLKECPDGILWLALVLGPFAEEAAQRQWFMRLLIRARHMASPSLSSVLDFDETLAHLTDMFIWTRTMTAGARRFWEESSWDAATSNARDGMPIVNFGMVAT